MAAPAALVAMALHCSDVRLRAAVLVFGMRRKPCFGLFSDQTTLWLQRAVGMDCLTMAQGGLEVVAVKTFPMPLSGIWHMALL